MTRIVAVDSIFAVADMLRAAEQYKRLGFEISYHDQGYAFAQRQGFNLHLDLTDSPPPGGGLLYLPVDDADQLAEEWRAAGAEVSEPQDFPWDKHEGSHTDPDGNTIRFGHRSGVNSSRRRTASADTTDPTTSRRRSSHRAAMPNVPPGRGLAEVDRLVAQHIERPGARAMI